ncbi:MAG: DNA alkylation repair protein [Clostridia bacterium]|nr:DNA alkylation repair protein [Clostridia bacterium]
MREYIKKELFSLQDKSYKEFHSRLIPNIESERIIGVRIPELRNLAKRFIKEGRAEAFIKDLPHIFYEENNLHAFILEQIKDYDLLISELERFLPYIDNWATCDSLRPKVFQRNTERLLSEAEKWMNSSHEYTVRFGIEVLMIYYLDEHFSEEYPLKVAEIKSDKYYINMMIAWYFATALAKQWNAIIPYIEQNSLSQWVHNKTIQKAIESYRITPEQKKYLKTLKR